MLASAPLAASMPLQINLRTISLSTRPDHTYRGSRPSQIVVTSRSFASS